MRRLLLALSVVSASWIAACSGSGTAVVPPPPVGKFSKADLKGQYAFVTSGESFSGNSATPLSRVGSFTADGQGVITSGLEDVNAAGIVNQALAITGGSYTVNADGRGTLSLTLNGANLQFGITLTTANGGLLIDETSNANQASTGSGNFIKQSAGSFSVSAVAGPYVFDFSGLDGNGAAASIVGQFAAAGGVIPTGFNDIVDNFVPTNGSFNGTFTPDNTNIANFGRGTAVINGISYAFYIVDSTRVRLLSTSGGTMLLGDATSQSNTIPANMGNFNFGFVFIVAGQSGTTGGGFTQIGRFTANGATVTKVHADANNDGHFFITDTTTAASINSYDPTNGRGVVTFKDTNVTTPFTYVFYLSSSSSGVIQDVSGTANLTAQVADGTIAAQVAGPLTTSVISNGYAFNWSGLSTQNGGGLSIKDEEDTVGQFNNAGASIIGAADIFQFQALAPGVDDVVSGALTLAGDGTGDDGMRSAMRITLTSSGSTTVNFVVYPVSPQLLFFASNNQSSSRIVAGLLQIQP